MGNLKPENYGEHVKELKGDQAVRWRRDYVDTDGPSPVQSLFDLLADNTLFACMGAMIIVLIALIVGIHLMPYSTVPGYYIAVACFVIAGICDLLGLIMAADNELELAFQMWGIALGSIVVAAVGVFVCYFLFDYIPWLVGSIFS